MTATPALARTGSKGILLGVLALATTVLLVATLVLGLTGATAATTWTGTIGVVLLAAWLVGINGVRPAAGG